MTQSKWFANWTLLHHQAVLSREDEDRAKATSVTSLLFFLCGTGWWVFLRR